MLNRPNLFIDPSSALPDYSNSFRFQTLSGAVDIYRDKFGIPHILAHSTEDAFFGQGFATAQDRFWQMECDRRKAYGRWSEYYGSQAIEQDKMMRRFRILESAKEDYKAFDSETRSMLDSYTAGINAFLESTTSFPIEYTMLDASPELWEPWDSLAVFKVRHIQMGVFESKLWRMRLVKILGPEKASRLLPGYQQNHLVIVPPEATFQGPMVDALEQLCRGSEIISAMDEIGSGSNSWVLSGIHTASGKPLLAGDPHRGLDVPNVYYQCHVSCPDFDVVGLSFAGCPGFPHFGHNSQVAWCITHAGADYQDLYLEHFNEGVLTHYEFEGKWEPLQTTQEIIKVRDGSDVTIHTFSTHHGPVITENLSSGFGIAFRYTSTAERNTGFTSVLNMLTASNADELHESMRSWVDPCNNFLYADVNGNIGYLTRGKIPIRSSDNAWLPVPGWTGKHEWQSHIPFEELPQSHNPDSGYIVTANNRITNEEYPYYIALDFAPEFRARRITDRIQNLQRATVDDMAKIHADRISIPAKAYQDLISDLPLEDSLSTHLRDVLVEWDGSMDEHSIAPTIYSSFRYMLNKLVINNLLGPLTEDAINGTGRGGPAHYGRLSTALVQAIQERNEKMLPKNQSWASLSKKAFLLGISYLQDRLGKNTDKWKWGYVHFTRPRHPLSDLFPDSAALLDPPSVPMAGDGDTAQAGSFSPASPFTMTSMSVARYVFDLADWENSRWVIPLGASGHPGSPHYADQTNIWGAVDMIPMFYNWENIKSTCESHQVLKSV